MIIDKLKNALSFLLIVILLFGGCDISMVNSTPKKVRILISGIAQPYILIELVQNDVFEITRFVGLWVSESELDELSDNVYDDTLLEDFIFIDPFLHEKFRGQFADSLFITKYRIVTNNEIELSQQQWEDVWNLVENVAKNNPDGAFEPTMIATETPHIWAIISGQFYWSLYCRYSVRERLNNPSINRNLVMLADELTSLADVSPFRSGR